MPFAIRPLTQADFPRLTPLLDEIHAYHVAGVPFFFKMPGPGGSALPLDVIREKIIDPDALVLVAEANGVLVGFLWAHVQVREESASTLAVRAAHVEALGITEAWRGKGVGRALMERAEAWGREQRCSDVLLEVWGFNAAAIAFYERLGYGSLLYRMRKPLTGADGAEQL